MKRLPSASSFTTSLIIVRKKAELDKELGGIKILREQSERRSLKAEERLQELLQGQTSAEQEAQRVAQARQDLDDVRKKLDSVQTENLVSKDSRRTPAMYSRSFASTEVERCIHRH